MSNKCFIVIAILALACVSACQALNKEISAEKLAKNFKEINAHLDKELGANDNPELMMSEVRKLLEKKSSSTCFSLFGAGSSFTTTLELLIDLAEPTLDRRHCSPHIRRPYLLKLDTGLASYPNRPNMNYIPTKMDKLIEYYAFKEVRLCDYYGDTPDMPIAYKRFAYSKINNYMLNVLPDNEDVDKNMDAALEYLSLLKPKDGYLADALRQFLQLKTILTKDSCNEEGYEVLLRNDLAVWNKIYNLNNHPGEVDMSKLRRIEKCILYYAKKHEEVCRPLVRESILAAVQKLDRDTYRKVLALISSHYLDEDSYEEVVEKVNEKEVDGDFRLPRANTDLTNKMTEGTDQFETKWKIQKLNMKKLYHFIKTLLAADPTFREREGDLLKKDSSGCTSADEIMKILNENLFGPCENYLAMMTPLMEINQYGRHTSVSYSKAPEDELVKDMTYNVAHDIYRTCKYVEEHKSIIFYNFDIHKTEFP